MSTETKGRGGGRGGGGRGGGGGGRGGAGNSKKESILELAKVRASVVVVI
jgi:U6 snRNA-associated Sm-like protein LSm7